MVTIQIITYIKCSSIWIPTQISQMSIQKRIIIWCAISQLATDYMTYNTSYVVLVSSPPAPLWPVFWGRWCLHHVIEGVCKEVNRNCKTRIYCCNTKPLDRILLLEFQQILLWFWNSFQYNWFKYSYWCPQHKYSIPYLYFFFLTLPPNHHTLATTIKSLAGQITLMYYLPCHCDNGTIHN